jgi:hypothetical protein
MFSKGPGGEILVKVLISGMRRWNKKLIQPLFGAAVFTMLAKKEIKASLCDSDAASPPWAQATPFEIHAHLWQVS